MKNKERILFIKDLISKYRSIVKTLEKEIVEDIDYSWSFLSPCQLSILDIVDTNITVWVIMHDKKRKDLDIEYYALPLGDTINLLRKILSSISKKKEHIERKMNYIKSYAKKEHKNWFISGSLIGKNTVLLILNKSIYGFKPEELAFNFLRNNIEAIDASNRKLFIFIKRTIKDFLDLYETILTYYKESDIGEQGRIILGKIFTNILSYGLSYIEDTSYLNSLKEELDKSLPVRTSCEIYEKVLKLKNSFSETIETIVNSTETRNKVLAKLALEDFFRKVVIEEGIKCGIMDASLILKN